MKSDEKVIITTIGIVGVITWFLGRAQAKSPPKGEVFIHEVAVKPATWDASDHQSAYLTQLERTVMQTLNVDLDEMVPRKKPSAGEVTKLQGILAELDGAGRSTSFLRTLLSEAQNIETENA